MYLQPPTGQPFDRQVYIQYAHIHPAQSSIAIRPAVRRPTDPPSTALTALSLSVRVLPSSLPFQIFFNGRSLAHTRACSHQCVRAVRRSTNWVYLPQAERMGGELLYLGFSLPPPLSRPLLSANAKAKISCGPFLHAGPLCRQGLPGRPSQGWQTSMGPVAA
jgi:hypothetical protein